MKRQVSLAANIQSETDRPTDKQTDRQAHRQIDRAIPRYFKRSLSLKELDSAICSSLLFGLHLFDFPIYLPYFLLTTSLAGFV